MEVINLASLGCGGTVSCTDVFVLSMQRMLLAAVAFNFSGMKRKKKSALYVYISDIYKLWISVTWLWPDNSAYATEHDRVTNGSMDVANSAEAHRLQNKFGNKWGRSPIHAEVIASSFLSVHQLQCWHGKDGEEEAKKGKEEKGTDKGCSRAKLLRVLKDQLYLLNRCIR